MDQSHQKRYKNKIRNLPSLTFPHSSNTVSEDFTPKSFRYHPGLFKINKWSCCRNVSRTALGCLVTTNWPERNNNYKSEYTRFTFILIALFSAVISNWKTTIDIERKFPSAVMSLFFFCATLANSFHCCNLKLHKRTMLHTDEVVVCCGEPEKFLEN